MSKHNVDGDCSIPYAIAIADLNNDQQLDIVVGKYDSHSIVIFNDYTNGSFQSLINKSISTCDYRFKLFK